MTKLNCLYLIMSVCIGLVFLQDSKPQLPAYAILENVDLTFGSKVEEGTAQVSEDLEHYVKWGFNYPDRGLVLIVATVNDLSKRRVYIRGHNVSREASLLMINREMIKEIK